MRRAELGGRIRVLLRSFAEGAEAWSCFSALGQWRRASKEIAIKEVSLASSLARALSLPL